MSFKRIDRFLDILEQSKNIFDMAAGAYIRQVNHTIENTGKKTKNKKKEDDNNGRYQQATGKPLGLINRQNG